MTLAAIKERIPDYGRDMRLNLDAVLSPEGAPGLAPSQIAGIALACAYAVESHDLAQAVLADHAPALGPDPAAIAATVTAAKGAATLMAMNNVYYRAVHLAGEPGGANTARAEANAAQAEATGWTRLPARLRMNLIGRPGIAKVDFELMCLAVSAIAGCGSCINSHVHEARKAGISDEGIQSAVRIGAVIQGTRRALAIALT